MTGYEARILDDADGWARNTVRLAIRNVVGDRAEFLLANGNWVLVEPGQSIADMGLILPRASIEAVAVAVQEWQGHTSHADTEARVLREWLTAERERVDRVLGR